MMRRGLDNNRAVCELSVRSRHEVILQEVLERINSDVANVAIFAAATKAFEPKLKKGSIRIKLSLCRLISLGVDLDLNDYHLELIDPSLLVA